MPLCSRTTPGWLGCRQEGRSYERTRGYLWNTNSLNSVSAVSVGSYRISAHESVGIASWRVTKARSR